VSPNPADDHVVVAVNSDINNAVILLVSSNGTEYVLQSDVTVQLKDSFDFNISSYPAGIYMLVIKNADNELLYSDKIMIR
jgi:hypothetical protein